MSNIVKSTNTTAISTEKVAQGTQSKGGDYTGGAVRTWNDYPPLQSISVKEPKNVLYSPYTSQVNGEYQQKVEGWAVTNTHVHVFTLIRPLIKIEGKKMKPNGQWQFGEHDIQAIKNKPTHRKGKVSNSYAYTGANTTSSYSPSKKEIPGANSNKPSGYQSQMALDIIPDEVKRPLENMIFNQKAKVFGQSLGYPDSEGRITQESSKILVINNSKAIVVEANREQKVKGKTPEQAREDLYTIDWEVSQFTYQIGEENKAINNSSQKKGITG